MVVVSTILSVNEKRSLVFWKHLGCVISVVALAGDWEKDDLDNAPMLEMRAKKTTRCSLDGQIRQGIATKTAKRGKSNCRQQ